MIVKIKTNKGIMTILNKPNHLYILDLDGEVVDNPRYTLAPIAIDKENNQKFLKEWVDVIGEEQFNELIKR